MYWRYFKAQWSTFWFWFFMSVWLVFAPLLNWSKIGDMWPGLLVAAISAPFLYPIAWISEDKINE